MKGRIPWNKGLRGVQPPSHHRLGVKHSEETKEKIRLANLGKHFPSVILRGPQHPNWRGGKVSLYIQIRNCFKYRQWRSDVFTRDNFSCQDCGDSTGGNLNADHIVPFIQIIRKYCIATIEQAINCEELWNINNGKTLCVPCHRTTPTYGEGAKTYLV